MKLRPTATARSAASRPKYRSPVYPRRPLPSTPPIAPARAGTSALLPPTVVAIPHCRTILDQCVLWCQQSAHQCSDDGERGVNRIVFSTRSKISSGTVGVPLPHGLRERVSSSFCCTTLRTQMCCRMTPEPSPTIARAACRPYASVSVYARLVSSSRSGGINSISTASWKYYWSALLCMRMTSSIIEGYGSPASARSHTITKRSVS